MVSMSVLHEIATAWKGLLGLSDRVSEFFVKPELRQGQKENSENLHSLRIELGDGRYISNISHIEHVGYTGNLYNADGGFVLLAKQERTRYDLHLDTPNECFEGYRSLEELTQAGIEVCQKLDNHTENEISEEEHEALLK